MYEMDGGTRQREMIVEKISHSIELTLLVVEKIVCVQRLWN